MAQSNDKIYDLINAVRLELKADIAAQGTSLAQAMGKLDQKFENMEQGRLASVEKATNDLRIKQATASTKLAVIGFIAATVTGAIVSTLVSKLVA
jgi:hypothetical protein